MVTRKPYVPHMSRAQYLELVQQIRTRSRAPFTASELRDYIDMLSRAQFILAIIFLLQGFTCMGFTDKSEYMNFCGASSLCGFCGLFGSFFGYLSQRYKGKKVLMVVHFILSIVSAVSSLLLVISTSIWTTELAKDTDKAYTLLPFWILLLLAVGQGVCFILSAVFICQSWQNRGREYSLGNFANMFEPMLQGGVTHMQSTNPNMLFDAPV